MVVIPIAYHPDKKAVLPLWITAVVRRTTPPSCGRAALRSS
jgi:hypothetical protein